MSEAYREEIEAAVEWIESADRVVVFTGAGISTDSGLPDYRGPDGVWTRRDKGLPPPKMAIPLEEVQPNAAHYALVRMQVLGKLDYLISQNVDGLHIASGVDPDRLAELHGNSHLLRCLGCERQMPQAEVGWTESRFGKGYRSQTPVEGQPDCPDCGGRLISSIINFGDPLPEHVLRQAYVEAQSCDLFFVIGSSLVVSPANELPLLALRRGARLIVLNIGETPIDDQAHLRIEAPIGEILPPIAEQLQERING